jgi:hypothetical protein
MLRKDCLYCGRTLVPDPMRSDWGYCPEHSAEHAQWATDVAYRQRVQPTLMTVGIPSWPHRG